MNNLVVTPHPLTLQGQTALQGVALRPGETLADLLARHGVVADQPGWVVSIGGAQVPALLWGRTRPAHGQLVEARRVAQDGDTFNDVLRLVAVVAIAYFTGYYWDGGLAAGMGWAQAGSFTGALINTGAFVLGSMVINKVLPPSMPTRGYGDQQTGTTYSLQGARNRMRHFEPLPLLFGQVRVAPDLAAQPYSWFAGEDQMQYVQLHAGLHVHTVTDIRIGDTSIDTYQGVTVGRVGFGDGSPVPTQWESVDTVAGALLDAPAGSVPGPWVVRTTSVDTVQIELDVVGSIYSMTNDGGFDAFSVRLAAEYRALPSGAWQPLVGSTAEFDFGSSDTQDVSLFGRPVLTVGKSSTTPVRRSLSKAVSAGQYEVRMRKVTANTNSTRQANQVEWSALKSYQAAGTAGLARKVVTIAIKSSGQLSGVLDQVTWLATSKPVPVWKGSAWVTETTSNPGAHFLAFARGEVDGDGRLLWGMGKPDAQIDIEGLKAWMLHCADQGYRFDHWFDAKASCADVLDALATAGLASKSYHTGKLGVVFMASAQPISAVVNMGNIRRGSMQVSYATRATAEELDVSWPDRDAGWLPRNLRLLAPGVTAPRETARLAPAGVTTQAGALVQGRLAMAQNLYGRKTVSWSMDLEALTFRRWSVIALSHDLTQWGYGGRLRDVGANLARWSEDASNAVWSKSSSTAVQTTDVPPPAGAQSVSLLTVTTGSTGVFQTFTVTPGEVLTWSFMARRSASAAASYRVYCNTSSSNVVPPTSYYAAINSADWTLVSVTFTVPAGCTSVRCYACAEPGGAYVSAVALHAGTSRRPYARTTSTAGVVALELDAEVPEGSTPHVALRLPGEAAWRVFAVAPYSGTVHELTLADPWPDGVALPGGAGDPVWDTLWICDFKAAPGQRLRVTDIQPQPGLAGARITAVPEPDEFWAYMASGTYTVPAGVATVRPVVISGLRVSQSTVITTTSYATELALTFDASGPFDHAQVWGGVQSGALAFLGETRTSSFSGWQVERGQTLYIEVRPFDSLGRLGTVASLSYTVAMTAYAPAAPTGLLYYVHPTGVQLQCDRGEAIVAGYDWRVGASFDAGTVVAEAAGTAVNWPMRAAGTYTVWVAAVDRLGTRGEAASMTVTIAAPGTPTLVAALVGPDVQIDVTAAAGAFALAGFEWRYGSTWAGGTPAGTEQATRLLRRVDWSGTRRWWVRAVDVAGNAGTPMSVDVTVTAPGEVTARRAEVVDNNVLLYWGPPSSGSLPVAEYRVRRGATWAGGTAIGSNGGSTFTTYFETQAGSYTYWMAAVDTAGNEGTPAAVTATVSQPPDYVLRADYNDDFAGITLSGMHQEGGRLYGPSLGETIQGHFESRGWATPNDQIVAGYPLVFEPSGTSGYAERVMDYGTVLPATMVSVTPTWAALSGAATLQVQISYKVAAGDAWTDAPAGATQALAPSFRYVKVRLTFTAAGGDDLVEVSGLNIKLSGKLVTDSGSGTAAAGDIGGTTVTFSVPFIDVSSITVTAAGTVARTASYDFADVPNPTGFKVLLFDTAGSRVSGGFSWTARGY